MSAPAKIQRKIPATHLHIAESKGEADMALNSKIVNVPNWVSSGPKGNTTFKLVGGITLEVALATAVAFQSGPTCVDGPNLPAVNNPTLEVTTGPTLSHSIMERHAVQRFVALLISRQDSVSPALTRSILV